LGFNLASNYFDLIVTGHVGGSSEIVS
jgi:hypothetical protein